MYDLNEGISACPDCFAAGKCVPYYGSPSAEQKCIHNRVRVAYLAMDAARKKAAQSKGPERSDLYLAFKAKADEFQAAAEDFARSGLPRADTK